MAHVVLLRGINVGGHRSFRPARLARQLHHLGVVNIGAAGTFVVRRPVTRTALRAEFARRLPFDAEVMICDGREIAGLVARNVFASHPTRPGVVRFVSLLARAPRVRPSLPLRLPGRGPWLVNVLAREGRFVFGLYRRQMKVIDYLGSLDQRFGVRLTTRNWNTIAAVARALNAPPV